MARKVVKWTGGSGRDAGKTFLITEMDAERAEEWGGRAVFALMASGIEISEEVAKQGLPGLAAIGVDALKKVPWETAKPLFDMMMACVTFVPDPSRDAVTRPLVPEDTEEVKTRLELKYAVLMLHLDFFTGGAL